MHLCHVRRRRALAGSLGCGSLLALSGCGIGATPLQGAGASFPAAIYQRWFSDLAGKQQVQVNYQSVGSGAGVRQFLAGTVDFGASDAPMQPDELAQARHGVVQLPLTAGAIAVAYNLPGCELKLSQAQLVAIFQGRIRNFRELGCAAVPIQVIVRSDGSGTTRNFTSSLSAFSPAWKAGPGSGKAVNWPVGVGAKGNEGIAASLQQRQGSLGYVEVSYVRPPLQAAAIQNAAGLFARPDNASASQALATIALGPALTGDNPNPPAGYPIVTFTWVLLNKSGNGARLPALQAAFRYALSDGAQAQAPELGYISLPAPVLRQARTALASVGP